MAHHNLFFHHLRRNSQQVGQPREISPKPPFPGAYSEPSAPRTEPRHCSPCSEPPPQSLQILEKRPQSYCYLEFHQIIHQVLCPQVFYHGVSAHHRQQQDETPVDGVYYVSDRSFRSRIGVPLICKKTILAKCILNDAHADVLKSIQPPFAYCQADIFGPVLAHKDGIKTKRWILVILCLCLCLPVVGCI